MNRALRAAVIGPLLLCWHAMSFAAAPEAGAPEGPLPRTVHPQRYRLELTILPEKERFSGRVEIDLALAPGTKSFYLHGRKFDVHQLTFHSGGKTIGARYTPLGKGGLARIDLDEPAQAEATLGMEYTAPFNDSLEALYRVRSGGEWYAFTQFEDISARDAFPGFDEPYFKVPFDIALVVHKDQVAVSNTPVTGTEALPGGLKRVSFATTRPLPTYLIAFAVGPFDVVEAGPLPPTDVRDRALPLRGLAVHGKGSQLAFALENTRSVVESLESWFAIPYPYRKLDLIAVPDFAAGAMENAGAITYRESLLLVPPNARPQDRRRFLSVHAHELAHQWFGDLVTPAWWNDIWLNESFATWMAAVALDRLYPDAGFRRDLALRMQKVMDADSLLSARQIRQPVRDNNDIADAFDGITYSKGGAVLAMFESLLGQEAFRTGVRNYLERHAWGTATADDFIRAVSEQSAPYAEDAISKAFHSFLEQPGLPLLQAKLNCSERGAEVELSQSRYLPLGSAGDTQRTWTLPVCLGIPPGRRDCLLLSAGHGTHALTGTGCPAYLMPNAGGKGYYRWSLDKQGWHALVAARDVLDPGEMLSLAGSLEGAFRAGVIDVPAWWGVALGLAAHADWRIATAPMDTLAFLYEHVAGTDDKPTLEKRFAELYGARLDRVGLDAPADNDSAQMQSLIVGFLAHRARLKDLREELRAIAWRYTRWPATDGAGFDPNGVNDNLVADALRVAVEDEDSGQNGGGRFDEHLLQLALASDDPRFRNRAFTALARSPDPKFRHRLLELALTDKVRNNEIYSLVGPQMDNPASREATWAWLQSRLDALLPRIPEWRRGRVASFGAAFCDAGHRAQVEAFFSPRVYGLSGGPRSLAQTLETIELCIAQANFHRPGLKALIGGQR